MPLTTAQVQCLYVLSDHKDTAFLELKLWLEPFGITQFYTDSWGAHQRHLEYVFHRVGKVDAQMIERKHLTLRTRIKRLARKTICFSKSTWLHDVAIGLFINRVEFGLLVSPSMHTSGTLSAIRSLSDRPKRMFEKLVRG